MVSTIRFPSFKKRSHHPRAVMGIAVAFAALLSLLVILQQRFFMPFFAVYILVALAMNLAWKFGWRGIALPSERGGHSPQAEEEETIQ